MLVCIFCANRRTQTRGEHIWDDWINWEDGKSSVLPSTTFEYGADGELIRSYPSKGLRVAHPVVCDECNSSWMSELTALVKEQLEPSTRRDEPVSLGHLGIKALAAFAFMKAAVLDAAALDKGRRPFIPRRAALALRGHFLSTEPSLVLPSGLQVWIARYQRTHVMEALTFTEEITGASNLKGYKILVCTYVLGSFLFQLTLPKWVKPTRRRLDPPFLVGHDDAISVPIWPNVSSAYWPPLESINKGTLQAFRERFRRIPTAAS